jgi:predicted ATPase/DNA-binding XRE family transcriptional regulator
MDEVAARSFAAVLAHYRANAGLTQEELAERAGLSARTISDLERGVAQHPYPVTVQRLLQALGLTEDDAALFQQAARRQTAAIGQPEAPRTYPEVRGALPLQPTTFIGREQEIAEVSAILRREEVRLLTLTGPGGVGKTRLALQVAEAEAARFPDGVAFVSLAALTDPGLVSSAIASTLGITETAGRSILETLTDQLGKQWSLLVLDNFEHLLPAALAVSELLASCPGLEILVTSRATLHLAAEHEYPVPPLPVPVPGHLPAPDALSRYDAIQLFVQRAQAVKPRFRLTNGNASAVAEICYRLDGLPLAIELAAARIKIFSPTELAERLADRFQLLIGGPRDVAARQQTLRNTIDWSYSLLSAAEQTLLCRLSVFVGGCTADAAQWMCSEAGDREVETLAVLEALVDQSLLVAEERDGEPRFRMLETIREHARERLNAEANALQRRCAQYFTELAEQVEADTSLARTDGPPSIAASHRVAEEESNLLAALAWSVQHREIELGLRLVGALRQAAISLGVECGLRATLETLLPRGDGVHPLIRARALLAADTFACAGARFEERNQWPGDLFNQALAICRQVGDKAVLLDALLDVAGMYLYYCDRPDRAGPLYEEALDLARDLPAGNAVGACLRGLGTVAESNHDLSRARLLWEQSLEAERAVSNTVGIAHSLHTLAFRALRDRDAVRATELCRAAVRTYREAGLLHQLGDVQLLQGVAALLGGRHSELVAEFRDYLSKMGARFTWLTANWLALIAASWATQGAATQAARLYAAATAFAPLNEFAIRAFTDLLDECLARGRSQVDEVIWEAAWEEGETITLQQAVAYALDKGA